ncbi:hypothetical protein [uncultured Rikenella sp.]|uniref:hypothetical protein n=1 Tax=uncultured Rikenella sp. TaxID=368003 RepID=UPI0026249A2F|nr:hypothetical protein [uncultured Rikenella sp.]
MGAIWGRDAGGNRLVAAPGFRDAGNNGRLGALSAVGNEGSVWSASANGTNGVFLRFLMNTAQSGYSSSRAFGFQLRCLSE